MPEIDPAKEIEIKEAVFEKISRVYLAPLDESSLSPEAAKTLMALTVFTSQIMGISFKSKEDALKAVDGIKRNLDIISAEYDIQQQAADSQTEH